MDYKTLNGSLYRKMIINGAISLKKDSRRIDDLNVFPVPDGDTGSNMSATILNGAKEVFNLSDEERLDSVAKVLSRGLLMGARGNSGVILSQLFSGIYKGLKGIEEATVTDFANALVRGYEQAYQAVINPVEGTILTVAREAIEEAKTHLDGYLTINDLFIDYLKFAKESLERTPELLPILKEVGVIDSGGAGYICVLEGMMDALNDIFYSIDDLSITSQSSKVSVGTSAEYDTLEKFGYCTEFIMQIDPEKDFDKEIFTKRIEALGDSLVVVEDDNILKVHIHTKKPGDALNIAQEFGIFMNLKIENMAIQHNEVLLHNSQEDNGCECEHHRKHQNPKYGIVAVLNGKGLKNTFLELGCDYIIEGGQTMNPSTEDFVKAVEEVQAENIFIIPNNKNVFLSAETAAKMMMKEKGKNILVLPAKTIAQGYASLLMFDATISPDENFEEMSDHIKEVQSGEVTYATRDTQINGITIKKDDFIGINNSQLVTSNVNRLQAVEDLIDTMEMDKAEIITIIYGSDVSSEETEELVHYIDMTYGIEVETISGEQNIYAYIIAVE